MTTKSKPWIDEGGHYDAEKHANMTPDTERPMQHYASPPQTPEKQALLRAVEIYLKCNGSFELCPDDCKLQRRHTREWYICSHLQQAGELMLKREASEDKGCYNTRTGGYVKGL